MLKSLIRTAVKVVDDAGVETVLTLAFVAQFAVYALPLHALDVARGRVVLGEGDDVVTGTVVQMPAKPSGARNQRTLAARETKGAVKAPAAAATKATRARRPDPVEDELAAEELDQLRAAESSVRITIIGPDGQPRTKVVRLSGSRDGMTAPARRPHD
jgi:hypothetical protein